MIGRPNLHPQIEQASKRSRVAALIEPRQCGKFWTQGGIRRQTCRAMTRIARKFGID